MSPRLAALAVIGVAGGIVIYIAIGATRSLAQYPLQQIQASVRVADDIACRGLPDGGMGPRYRTRNFYVRVISDAGDWLTDWQPKSSDGGECFRLISQSSWRWNLDGGLPEQHWCSCRGPTDAGTCNVDRPALADGGPDLLPDGGQRRMAALFGVTLAESQHPAGPACVRKPCVETLGFSSMPEECAP